MSLISVSNLSFSYEGSVGPVFENVSFQMDTNWRLGFIGRNGRGKTTFLRLLMGEFAYEGSIHASVEFEYFPYPVEDPEDLTVNVLEGMDPMLESWRLLREFSLLQLSEDVLYRPFSTLSYGERTKVLLAALFLRENRFLLIDEPTNHLDAQGRQLIGDYLMKKKGFILVSHDRAFLDRCVDHVLSINRANIEVQSGNFSSWWENKRRQDEFERQQNEKLRREIGRLQSSVQEKSRWADASEKKKIGFDPTKTEKSLNRRPYEAAKSKKANKRAKAILNRAAAALEEKSQLLKNVESAEALQLHPARYHTARMVEGKGIQAYYGGKPVFAPLTFSVEQGERIALCGRNGCGKSTLLKLILGEDIAVTGELRVGSRLKISYVSQQTDFLTGLPEEYARQCGIDRSLFFTILRKLDFSREQFEKNMEAYSQGQKKKVLLAKSLCEQAHLYIWDEPLNYVDVFSRMQLEELLMEYRPTLLFVEHDRVFCEKIATRLLEIEPPQEAE